jgi:hypothetical protein
MANDTDFTISAYNLDNNRPNDQMVKEVKAIAKFGDDVLCFCEAVGYNMPGLDGFVMYDRDKSRPGRENIVTYVNVKWPIDKNRSQWHDLNQTWTRTNPGASGQHWPRSIQEVVIGQVQLLNLHNPPKGTDNVQKSQQESIDKLVKRMTPNPDDSQSNKRPRISVGDFNRRPEEDGPGPGQLANKVGGYSTGDKIDCAVRRQMGLQWVKYLANANGVDLKSDHGHMMRIMLKLDGAWLKKA